jgi:chitinase
MPNSSSGLTWEGSDKDVLRRLVTAAKKSGKGTKIVLSVGK